MALEGFPDDVQFQSRSTQPQVNKATLVGNYRVTDLTVVSANGGGVPVGSPPRVVTVAPFYRSFPMEAVRRATRGLALTLVGTLTEALRRSLPEAEIRNVVPWPRHRAAGADGADGMLQALAQTSRTDWTLVVDPDAAQLLQANSDFLFLLRQLTRRAVVIPLAVDREHIAVTDCRYLSVEEVAEYGRWRWIDNEEGWAEIEIWSARDWPNARFSFTPWFCGPALEAGLVQGALVAMLNDVRYNFAIEATRRISIPLPLRAGSNVLRVETDVPSAPSADPRHLSIALFEPEVEMELGLRLTPTRFLGGDYGPVESARLAFHAAGFEYVAGLICGTGHAPGCRPVPESHGNPLTRMQNPLERWRDSEPTIGADEIAWLFCGEPMQ